MKKILAALVLVACALCLHTDALAKRKKRTKKKKNTAMGLVVALRQHQPIQGKRDAVPGVRFVVVWNDAAQPSGIIWHDSLDWLPCDINMVKNYNRKTSTYEASPMIRSLQQGDTLELRPAYNSKYKIPEEIMADRKNVIYYQPAGKAWTFTPVAGFKTLK